MNCLWTRVLAILLGSMLIFGCSGNGGGSDYNVDDGAGDGTGVGAAGGVSIDFISATPETIALKGTGGPSRSETSVLVFMVVDEYADPVPNETVEFELSTEVGGLSLSNSSAVTNSGGMVQTTVNAGNVSTHIRVCASLPDTYPLVSVVSDELLVSTGLPDQNSISLSAETYNVEGLDWDGETVSILFQAADHFNNFVPDGTVVYFTTEGGAIDDSDTTLDGECVVEWHSGNPRPADDRITILAFCIGEESFADYNGNGFFDSDDWFDLITDRGEPWRDDNESGDYDWGEPWWDYNSNEEFDSEGNGIYNGTLCSDDAEAAGLCTTELVYLRASISMINSGSYAFITIVPSSVTLPPLGSGSVIVTATIQDENQNVMPAGTTIEFSTTNGTIVSDSSFEVANTNSNIVGTRDWRVYSVELVADEEPSTGWLYVVVTTPNGVETTASVSVTD